MKYLWILILVLGCTKVERHTEINTSIIEGVVADEHHVMTKGGLIRVDTLGHTGKVQVEIIEEFEVICTDGICEPQESTFNYSIK